jgi:hypothetical protein
MDIHYSMGLIQGLQVLPVIIEGLFGVPEMNSVIT